jgi:hypothetical protein
MNDNAIEALAMGAPWMSHDRNVFRRSDNSWRGQPIWPLRRPKSHGREDLAAFGSLCTFRDTVFRLAMKSLRRSQQP